MTFFKLLLGVADAIKDDAKIYIVMPNATRNIEYLFGNCLARHGIMAPLGRKVGEAVYEFNPVEVFDFLKKAEIEDSIIESVKGVEFIDEIIDVDDVDGDWLFGHDDDIAYDDDQYSLEYECMMEGRS